MTTPIADVPSREPCLSPARGARSSTSHQAFSEEARGRIRLSAIAVDAHATNDVDLPSLWHDLAGGLLVVAESFFTDARCYLVLASRGREGAQRIDGRRLEILTGVLGGLPQTNLAIDLSLAPSTVALNCKIGLENLGVSGRPSRAHPLLMLAARAAAEPSITVARSSSFAIDDQRLRVVATRRPDAHLAELLPAAELAVIRRLVEGLCYAEIAAERGTSTRTIANQITAVFRRLHVSGRNELLHRLLLDEGLIRLLPKLADTSPPLGAAPRGAHAQPWRETRRSA